MICGAVNRIFAYYRSLNCSQIIKKQRQECLTSDNNNSTIADLQKKRRKDNNVRFIGFNSKIIVTNNYCIPRTKYVRGILWFSRRYVVTPPPPRPQTLHRSHDKLKNPYRIASIFYM